MSERPLTVVVRRRVPAGGESAFEEAMREFMAFALASPGNRGINVLRPQVGSDRVYTVVDRFADVESRRAFTASPQYADWMRRLADLSEGAPHIEEIGGLGGWFTPPGVVPHPSRVKMALVTFLGVYPLTSTLPPLGQWLFPGWHPLALNVLVTGCIVAALTWAVMPVLTRVFRRFLFGAAA
jgi:antibiotic biosynthesis monooxygenase (ABM) superfamily enzyme